jgi:hypothetical protein
VSSNDHAITSATGKPIAISQITTFSSQPGQPERLGDHVGDLDQQPGDRGIQGRDPEHVASLEFGKKSHAIGEGGDSTYRARKGGRTQPRGSGGGRLDVDFFRACLPAVQRHAAAHTDRPVPLREQLDEETRVYHDPVRRRSGRARGLRA